ncbi:MAG: YidH family protein [Mycobacterium sp.]
MPEPGGPEADEPQEVVLMRQLVDLSLERTRQSSIRTEMSAERSYMNAERTLSVWIRTSMASMVVGIAVDRLGLSTTPHRPLGIGPDTVSSFVGAALVGFGVLIVAIAGARFRRYATEYWRTHVLPQHHGPFMAPAFALLTSLFGAVLLILVLLVP